MYRLKDMRSLEQKELYCLIGGSNGVSLTGTLVNALTGAIKALFDVGRNLGSAIRRISCDEMCPIR